VRAGSAVIIWGESTFIPAAINVINAVDVATARAGAELKEGLISDDVLWGSVDLTKAAASRASYLTTGQDELDPSRLILLEHDSISDDRRAPS